MFGVRKEENSGDSSQLLSMPPLQASPHGIGDNPSLHTPLIN